MGISKTDVFTEKQNSIAQIAKALGASCSNRNY